MNSQPTSVDATPKTLIKHNKTKNKYRACLDYATFFASIAAVITAAAAAWQVYILNDTEQRQLRSYLSPTISAVSFQTGAGGMKANIVFNTIGITPAYGITAQIMMAALPTMLPPKALDAYKGGSEETRQSNFILPNTPGLPVPVVFPGASDSGQVNAIAKGKGIIVIYGRVDYFDSFKCKRFIKYCYRGSGALSAMAECGNEYADSDDPKQCLKD